MLLKAGVAQLARASAFQAEGRGFEPRFPLVLIIMYSLLAANPDGSGAVIGLIQ